MTREEALRKLKAWDFLNNDEKEVLETLIPEFQESKNERIRRELIEHFRWNAQILNDFDNREVIVWLEKQSEQKPFDYENANIPQNDFAPKFKFGDWIVWKDKCYKVNDNGCGYELINQDGLSTSLEYGTVDENAHLWTIEDARDGDVLVEDSCIFIIQKLGDNSTAAKTYCTLYNDGDFEDGSILYFDIDSTKPATKAQRDTLFTKMHEAGYVWDVEEKELRKIENQGEQKDINLTLIEKEKMDNAFTKMMLKGKTKWTEEDNDVLDTIESWLDTLCEYLEDSSSECIPNVKFCINWLESLKQRMEERQ